MWYFSWMLGLPLAILLSILCTLIGDRFEDR
ncbi:cytochrome bd-I oxidase subunit CydX [Neisseria sp. Ec49-e6-T10]